MCNHIRYVRGSLAVVVFSIVTSESSRSSGTDFAVEDMMENFRALLVYIAANFRIVGKYSKFLIRIEYSSHL